MFYKLNYYAHFLWILNCAAIIMACPQYFDTTGQTSRDIQSKKISKNIHLRKYEPLKLKTNIKLKTSKRIIMK